MDEPTNEMRRQATPVASLRPATGPTLNFYSFDEIIAFAQAEQRAWTPIREPLGGRSQGWLQALKNMMNLPMRLEGKAVEAEDQGPGGAAIRELVGMLGEWDGRYVTSDSPTGMAAINLAKDDVYAGALLVGLPIVQPAMVDARVGGEGLSLDIFNFIAAVTRVELEKNGIPDLSRRQRAFDELHVKVQQQIEDTKASVEHAEAATVNARNQFAALMDEHSTILKSLVSTTAKQLDEQVARADASIVKAKAIYLENIKIHAAVEYWRTIANTATSRAESQFRYFVGAAVAAAGVAVGAVLLMLNSQVATVEQIAKLGLAGTAMISFPIVLVLWILKHLARGLVDAQKTAADARHRSALVETYLALLNEDQAVPSTEDGDPPAARKPSEIDEKVRLLMLGAIFSHPGTASEADTLPATIVEAVIGKK